MDAHEAAQMHQNFSQQLLQDHIAACSLPEHNLISVGHMGSAPLFRPLLRHGDDGVSVFSSSGRTAPHLSRSKLRTGPPPASPACYERAADGTWPTSRAAIRPLKLRKESIILSSRLLHDCRIFNCYKTIPGVAGISSSLTAQKAVGTRGWTASYRYSSKGHSDRQKRSPLFWPDHISSSGNIKPTRRTEEP